MERQQDNVNGDEIDLRELIRSVLNTRRLVLAGVVAVGLGYFLILGLQAMATGTTTTYSKSVRFVFDGVSDGRYPGGTRFRMSDVIAEPVLMQVYEQNGLAELGVGFSEFADAVSIAPHTPRREFIVQRYRNMMNRGDLSMAEMQELEERFAEELERETQKGARITLTTNQRVVAAEGPDIDAALARKLVNDIPRVWTSYMREVRGVDRPRLELLSEQAINEQFIERMDYLIVFEYLRDKINDLRDSIDQLRVLPNAGAVRDPESNLRLVDVDTELRDTQEYMLESLMAPAVSLGLSRTPERTRQFFLIRIQDQERAMNLAMNNAELVAETLDSYSRNKGVTSPQRLSPGGQQAGTTIPQFGSDFLDRLVELGTDAADVEFRQQLSQEHLEYAHQAVARESNIQRLRELVDLMGESSPNSGEPVGVMESLEQELNEGISEILNLLRTNMARVERIADGVMRLSYGSDRAFFRDITDGVEVRTTGHLKDRVSPLTFTLLILLTAIATVFAGLLRNMMRQEKP